MGKRITGGMTIAEVVREYPQTLPVFFKHGLGCVGCAIAASETVEQASMAHGLNLEEFVGELEKAAAQQIKPARTARRKKEKPK